MSIEAIIKPVPVAEIAPPPSLTGVLKAQEVMPPARPNLAEGLFARMSLLREWGSHPGIGRQRWESLRYLRRRGRGPCGACDSGQEEGHHGGSKCRKRRMPGMMMRMLRPRLVSSILPAPFLQRKERKVKLAA